MITCIGLKVIDRSTVFMPDIPVHYVWTFEIRESEKKFKITTNNQHDYEIGANYKLVIANG